MFKLLVLYWEKELSRKVRCDLYEKILPIHPKGSDSSGEYFSMKGLKEKINASENDKNRIQRIKDGYIIFFKFKDINERISIINSFEDLEDQENIKIINEIFERGPQELSRHAGFRNTCLNNFIFKKIEILESSNYQYIEYGCPTWGPLKTLIEKRYNCLSILPKSSIFWNKYDTYPKINNLKTLKEEDLNLNNYDLKGSILGLILVLDHLEDPKPSLEILNSGIQSIAIIVEKVNRKESQFNT